MSNTPEYDALSQSNLPLTAGAPLAGQQGPDTSVILQARRLTIRYGNFAAIKAVDLPVHEHKVTAIIGPSGCGKSTLLRHFNRLNEYIAGVTTEGEVLFRGENLYQDGVDPVAVRRRIGMVFQTPNPFPTSIFDNVAWAPRLNKLVPPLELPAIVERALRQANLWQEVQDRLEENALSLSGGQQQRLCLARTIALQPEVILMDEPCSALDPQATAAIEELIIELKSNYTIVIVTHNLQQALRVSDCTAYLVNGELIEFGSTSQVFSQPIKKQTAEYVSGRFG